MISTSPSIAGFSGTLLEGQLVPNLDQISSFPNHEAIQQAFSPSHRQELPLKLCFPYHDGLYSFRLQTKRNPSFFKLSLAGYLFTATRKATHRLRQLRRIAFEAFKSEESSLITTGFRGEETSGSWQDLCPHSCWESLRTQMGEGNRDGYTRQRPQTSCGSPCTLYVGNQCAYSTCLAYLSSSPMFPIALLIFFQCHLSKNYCMGVLSQVLHLNRDVCHMLLS